MSRDEDMDVGGVDVFAEGPDWRSTIACSSSGE